MTGVSRSGFRAALPCLMLGLLAIGWTAGRCAAAQDKFAQLPQGWKIAQTITVPQNQLAGFSQRLGGQVTAITNTIVTADGKQMRVNRIRAAGLQDAERIYQSLVEVHGGTLGVQRLGEELWELSCPDQRLAARALHVFGFVPNVRRYRVTFDAAPLETCDYMSLNPMFNQLLIAQQGNAEQQSQARQEIERLKPHFRFGNTLALRRNGQGEQPNRYRFDPEPIEMKEQGDVTVYRFGELPKRFGIPFVAVVAEVQSQAYAGNRGASAPHVQPPNPRWPSDDAEISRLAEQILAGKTSDQAKTAALLQWFSQTENIRYGGPVTGSRYGTQQVLRQRYGHCWDYSDLFITLARAGGLPARQVGGWLHGVDGQMGGHIWVEVWSEPDGWVSVDPTLGDACNASYVPYITSELGEFPLLYASPVTLQPLDD